MGSCGFRLFQHFFDSYSISYASLGGSIPRLRTSFRWLELSRPTSLGPVVDIVFSWSPGKLMLPSYAKVTESYGVNAADDTRVV